MSPEGLSYSNQMSLVSVWLWLKLLLSRTINLRLCEDLRLLDMFIMHITCLQNLIDKHMYINLQALDLWKVVKGIELLDQALQ